MKKKFNILIVIISVCLSSVNAQQNCVYDDKSYPVTLKVIDPLNGKLSNPSGTNKDKNIYAWIDANLKVQNPRQPNNWWYPMYKDNEVESPTGALVSQGNRLEWTLILQLTPGVYSWKPGAKSIGWHFLNPTVIRLEDENATFEVASDGTITGITEISLPYIEYAGTPYNGPHIVPCTIQAEDFDNGGEGVAYHDQPGMQNGKTNSYRPENTDVEIEDDGKNDAYHIGWTGAGEWYNYTISVETKGKYDFIFSWATLSNNDEMTLAVNNAEIETCKIPNTGAYDAYEEFTIAKVNLEAGKQLVTVFLNHGNFDKFRIVANDLNIPKIDPYGKVYAEGKTLYISDFSLITSLEICNIIGNKIYGSNNITENKQIPLHTGIYIVKIVSGKKSFTQKIIIK
jgi:hypothetical protein